MCQQNQTIIENFIKKSKYFDFLCKEQDHRSIVNTCITLKENNSWKNIEIISDYCEKHNIGYDIKGHTKGLPCIRIWHGYTIDTESLENLLINLENVVKKCLY